MTAYTEATLGEGRVIVGRDITFTLKGEKQRLRGLVCETTHAGKDAPCAVVKLRDATLRFVRLVNVSPGKTIKQPGT